MNDWDSHHADAAGHGHGHGHEREDPRSAAELAGLLAGLPHRPGRVLDLGCGTGADAVLLAGLGLDVAGIDDSATAIGLARERAAAAGVEVEWRLGDVLELPFADDSIDLLLDHGCLHHVANEDLPRYAAEAARVLAPGGTFVIRERHHAGHHAHAADEESIVAMLDGTPLEVRSVVRYRAGSAPDTPSSLIVSIGPGDH